MLFISEERAVKRAQDFVSGVHFATSNIVPDSSLASYVEDIKALLVVLLEGSNDAVTMRDLKRYLELMTDSAYVPASALAKAVLAIFEEEGR